MLRPGDTFDKYVIERLLNAGGMGEVYVVRHARTKKRAALKIILPHLLTDPSMVERFLQEAQIGARIEDADHIVDVLDAGRDASGSPWLVMEYLSGRDLGQLLDKVGTLAPEVLVEVLRQTAEALDAAHAKGVVHRDIKPENLFVVARPNRPNVVKVLDFGIAKILEQQTHTGTTAGGTIAYMAPEQGEGRTAIGPRADVWPLGLIAYRALTGQPYWLGDTAFAIMKEVVADELAKASERAREQGHGDRFDAAFDDFFARCVHRDPEARFATAGGAVSALAAALGVTERTPLSIPEALVDTAPDRRVDTDPKEADTDRAPVSAAPSSRRGGGTDLEVEVRVAEVKYAEQRRKQLALALKLAAIPLLVVVGVAVGLWYDARATDAKRRDAWASFLTCAVGRVPDADNGLLALRRRSELQKTVDRLAAASLPGGPARGEGKSELHACVHYARVVSDLTEREDARGVAFGKAIAPFLRPADIPKELVTDALETVYQAGLGVDLAGGTADRGAARPKLATVPIDASAEGTLTIPSTSADLVGTTQLRAGGVRRRSFDTPTDMVVCDFSKRGFDCGTYGSPDVDLGSVTSAPPLGEVIVGATRGAQVIVPRRGSDRKPIEVRGALQGAHAGDEAARFVRGAPDGGIEIVRANASGELAVERRVETASFDDAAVFASWNTTLLAGRPKQDPEAEPPPVPDDRPTRVFDVPSGAEPRLLGELRDPIHLAMGCRAGATTYVYLYDVSIDRRAGLVTFRGDAPPVMREIPIGGYRDVSCDDTGISFAGRLRCPPEGKCEETPTTDKIIGWGGCTDGSRDYAIEGADEAWILWRGPAGQALTPSVLLDVADIVVEPASFACGTGFAYALVRSRSSTRVIDLTTDPPRML